MKKLIAMLLALAMVLSLAACGETPNAPETTTEAATEPTTMDWIKKDSLKILTLGHSLAVDCGHMLALIAATEGYEHMKVATLYYSGCPLYKHVEFLTKDEPAYNLYLSSTDKPNIAPETTDGVTMKYALNYEYWDIIVMMGGVFEVARSVTYTNGDIQTIQNYVKDHTAPYKYPRIIVFKDELPKTVSGKIIRNNFNK